MEDLHAVVEALKTTPGVGIRQGAVSAVNADFTLDVTIGGATTVVPGVRSISSCCPRVGDGVWILSTGRDLIVFGVIAPAGRAIFTPEGGLAVRLTNGTGAASVKGSLVSVSTTADDQFVLQANEFDTVGVVYESGVAAGDPCLVVVSGRCELLLKDNSATTRGQILIAADTDGRCIGINNPGIGLPGTETHFKEVGHCLKSVTAGTDKLTLGIIHFN